MAASSPRTSFWRFWRYNYQILMGTGYWILFLPVAASFLVGLWMMPMLVEFKQTSATAIGELMTPILGAFLAAHSLAPEYRSGIGAVLACKPIPLGRVVALRVALAMLAAFALALLVLVLCSLFLAPIDVWSPMAASLPSLWFLSLLALTFATLFRNALAGFGMAAAVWALDLVVGYGVHPLLSLQGLRAVEDLDPLAGLWGYGKATLVLLGFVLLWVQGRLLHRITRPPERADVRRMVLAAMAVALLYCASGAAIMVAYAYSHRATLQPGDVVWLRRQLGAYGPVPVAPLFGGAFATYVDNPPVGPGEKDVAPTRVRQLKQGLARWPGSPWAPAIAYELALQEERAQLLECAADYFAVADRFGSSPFAPKALGSILRIESEAVTPAERLRAARRLISDYPRAAEVERAAESLLDAAAATPEEQMAGARLAATVAPRFRRPSWLMILAELQAAHGQPAAAVATARQAYDDAQGLLAEERRTPVIGNEIAPHRARLAETVHRSRGLIDRGGQPAP